MINIQEAKTHLSRFVESVQSGEEIIIAKAGKPMAKLVPYSTPRPPRKGGFYKDEIWEANDCWDSDPELDKLMTEAPLLSEVTPSK